MGNDQSQMSGMEVEKKAVEVTDFWAHHSATISSGNTTTVSVFIGEPLIGGSLWVSHTPLEKSSKNLMIFRHPCILKYISSWNKGSKYYLAVEDVKPLTHVLANQNVLQICIGLHSILKAIVFLHEKAMASHNNICSASIYVTKDGSWKLGGMEYLCKYKDITPEYIGRSRAHRYNKAIDPNEDKNIIDKSKRIDCIDIYAFATLVMEVFKKKSDENVPTLNKFLELCKNDMQNIDIKNRPKLSALLENPFFNHEFIYIHSFLTELPLKSDEEKTNFFSNLVSKLRSFNETTIACQFGGLLLSRMVLLNKTAQTDVIPFILIPKEEDDVVSNYLFTTKIFKKQIVPKLLEIFRVRDAQIRLLLLEYFNNHIQCFTREELQLHILPELLVGIKDTNDHLVAVTLRSLADLVTLLGAATVIGGKRAKLFNDGRPIVHPTKPRSRRNSRRPQEINLTPIMNPESDVLSNSSGNDTNLELPERPSPDGEEGETSADEVEGTVHMEEGEEENWEDWDINDNDPNQINGLESNQFTTELNSSSIFESNTDLSIPNLESNLTDLSLINKKSMPDISELDIKNQTNSIKEYKTDEFDFFQDMEPVIETSTKFVVSVKANDIVNGIPKLDLGVDNTEHQEEGWGDDDWDKVI